MDNRPDPPHAHQLRPGDAYAPLRFSVSEELNQQYLFALEEYGQQYLRIEGSRALVHPVLLLHMSARTRSPSFRLAPGMGSVFAKDAVSFCRPAYVEELLEVTWTIREVYERKGRLYQALDTLVAAPDGEPVLRREAHSVFFTQSGVALTMQSA